MSHLPVEISELRSTENAAAKITVHGMMTALSPLKKGRSCNYFEGFISDETDKTRVVGFSSSQQRVLSEFMENKQAVMIQDSQAKLAHRGDKIELLLKGSTKIKASQKRLDIPWQEFDMNEPPSRGIILSEVPTAEIYERINVAVKVYLVTEPVIAGDKKKQDVYVADHTAANNVVQLWENDIGTMAEGVSYKLVVREYAHKRYLSKARNDSSITEVDDIGEVYQPAEPTVVVSKTEIIYGAEIVGVAKLEKHKVCLCCRVRAEPKCRVET